jgi:hypothetical protein
MLELFYSRWKGRKFLLRNALVYCGLFAEGILAMVIVSFVFEFAYPNLSFTNGPQGLAGLAVGLMAAMPVVTIAFTSRIPKISEYLMKIFE